MRQWANGMTRFGNGLNAITAIAGNYDCLIDALPHSIASLPHCPIASLT